MPRKLIKVSLPMVITLTKVSVTDSIIKVMLEDKEVQSRIMLTSTTLS